MAEDYTTIQITVEEATALAKEYYDLEGKISALPGELDFNFKVKSSKGNYILKVSRPNVDIASIEYQNDLLEFVSINNQKTIVPDVLKNLDGEKICHSKDSNGKTRVVRLLTWIDGKLLSSVNPQNEDLLLSLGVSAGSLTKSLQGFDHETAHRYFEWDILQASWTFEHVGLFNDDQQELVAFYHQSFEDILPKLNELRKAIVHNDANDNNVIITDDLLNPRVKAIIDYGDAIYTPIINDLAITIAYAVMGKPDVLRAALPIIKGYHEQFPLLEEELALLYTLIAMRLVISVTKSAINKQQEPDNEYLLISEKPAWEVLAKWRKINKELAYYSFRESCGYAPHPNEKKFASWAKSNSTNIDTLFPNLNLKGMLPVDMSVSSTWLGHETEISDNDLLAYKLQRLQQQNPASLLAGGYGEGRLFYTTNAYKKEGNNGPEYRTVHLGIDFWVDEETAVHSPFEGHVYSVYDNDLDKDYGPTIILEHIINDGAKFYILYGHLSKKSLGILKLGEPVAKGDLIGHVGDSSENGNWAPHLHFQIMLDMLGSKTDFPGVAYPDEIRTWESLCPNPNMLFNEVALIPSKSVAKTDILSFRKEHLGKSLSLSYDEPLNIVRGSGAYLFDDNGRKYLDTINNVAHVGHEHAEVVKAGQAQMAVLNTNTRYLHTNITDFAAELLSTLPEELSIVHFVNTGSEANELAIRMAEAYTGQKDMIAIEVGYHGNTARCISVSSYKFDGKGGNGAPEHTHIVPMPDAYRGIYQGENTGEQYAQHVHEQVKSVQSQGRNIAGFIAESIISCGGQVELPENYLKLAYETIREAGGLCIADEVQVGCGRVGSSYWGFQLHGVIPDIVTIGKPIGNGHPLAAVVCTKEVADAFANGMEYFNTFGGNPVSCAIGMEVLNVIKIEKLQENALSTGNYLKEQLKNLKQTFPIIGDVRGQGLFLGFELVGKNKQPLPAQTKYLANRMRELAVLMSTDGKDNNVIKIKPPLVFSKENTDELISRLTLVFTEDFMQNY